MGRPVARDLRRLIAATAAVGGMAIGAGSAEATPLHATFDDGVVGPSAQNSIDVLEPPNQATLQGEVIGNAVTIQSPSGINVPPASGSYLGFFLTFSVGPTGSSNITGTLSGGDLSLDSHPYRAVLSFANGPTCTYDTSLPFSTDNPSFGPFNGDPFTTGLPDTTLTQGILETHWNSLPPAPEPGCNTFPYNFASGAGGFALAHGFDLPGTPLTPPPPQFGGDPPDRTGKRAAALRKCKRKAQTQNWSKKRLRKCKRRARLLPV